MAYLRNPGGSLAAPAKKVVAVLATRIDASMLTTGFLSVPGHAELHQAIGKKAPELQEGLFAPVSTALNPGIERDGAASPVSGMIWFVLTRTSRFNSCIESNASPWHGADQASLQGEGFDDQLPVGDGADQVAVFRNNPPCAEPETGRASRKTGTENRAASSRSRLTVPRSRSGRFMSVLDKAIRPEIRPVARRFESDPTWLSVCRVNGRESPTCP